MSAALTLALLVGCTSTPHAPRQGPPDVFLIVVDTLRADHLGSYGYAEPTSPAIDALAKDALVFDRAYSTAPWTLPSISTILSGRYGSTVGVMRGGKLDGDVPILTTLYRDHGYATGAVVSHLFLREKFGLTRGMEHVDTHEIVKNPHMHISSPQVTQRALAMLDDHLDDDADQPMFMLVHYFDVHYNYFAHPEVYDPDPTYDGPVRSGMPYAEVRKLVRAGTGGDATLTRIRQLYDAEIRFTDQAIGELIAGLKARHRYDNAMVVLVADHGEELGDRSDKWVGHTRPLTEDTLHVPLVMKLPAGARAGQRIPWPVSLIDLMPTIASLTGVETPSLPAVAGRVLDLDDGSQNRDSFMAETHRQVDRQAILHDGYRLRRDFRKQPDGTLNTKAERLFSIADDPAEATDVSTARPEILGDLQARLTAWDRALRAETSTSASPTLTKDEEEALRAMGYIE